jgi:predicted Zn finger-like uncharacterized protein
LNFSCDKCGRKYSVSDDRVGDKGVKIRCKQCGNLITVKPPEAAAPEESTRMVSLAELQRGGVAAGAASAKPVPTPSPGSSRATARSGGKRPKSSEGDAPPPPEPPSSTSSPGPSPWEGEATRAVVAPDPNAQWFAMVKGQQVGPFDLRGLSGKVKQGEVGLKTFVWHDGMADWKRAEELPELALMFAGGVSKEGRAAPAPMKVEAMKSIAAALQKSAAGGMRSAAPSTPARGTEGTEETRRGPLPEETGPAEMIPAEADPDHLDAPMTFDLAVDGDAGGHTADGVDIPGLAEPQELDLMATASTLAEVAAAPVTPVPAAPSAAPAMSSAAAVTVTPSPTRRNPRKGGKELTPMPPMKAEPAPAPEPAPELDAPEPAAKEPAAAAASGGGDADLGSDLFSDLDLRRSGEHARPIDPGDLTRTADEPPPNGANGSAKVDSDPFAKLGKAPVSMLPKPGQATNFVISQAGMDRRNPAWKIAVFVVLLVGLPVGVMYALSEMNVVPLQITHVDQATGETVTDKVFSTRGVSGLRDLLMGKHPAAAPPAKDPKGPKEPREQKEPKDGKDTPAAATGTGKDQPNAKQLSDLYQDGQKKDVGPAAPKVEPKEDHQEAVGGPPKEEINKVVEATQRAFQFCIEQELKKNPGFKGGKVRLVATVGASGVVKKASIDREDIDQSDLGECLKGKAKRMTFSAFSGDDVDLEIPLILSTAM